MAESRNSNELIEEACRKLSEKLNFPFKLKTEQRNALESLLNGNDVLAVLPTGYGKSLIFQLYILVAQIERIKRTALVVCPLRSIIDDQIGEARGFGISIASLADLSEDELKASEFELLFGSAETVLDKRFLDILKDPDASLNRVLSVIVIDESHTVEMWTGQRSRGKNLSTSGGGFREAFGKLSTLRSFCKQGTHVLAITGTADDETQKVIIKGLSLKQTKRFYVSPNRPNLRISVIKCKKQEMFTNLEWLIRLVKEQGTATPKSIIFCNGSLTDIAAVFNHMLLQLGSYAYFPQDSQTSPNCLVGIYHSLTLQKYKDRITNSFKGNGKKRIIIASSALSMGVNFPDVRYVIHWGPSRNMLDYHQQSGRGGRDNKPTQVLTIYYGQQISFCEENVKAFLRTTSCYRIEAYKPFDRNITPVKPAHACCRNCAKTCKCSDGENECSETVPVFEVEKNDDVLPPTTRLSRPISSSDKEDLHDGLHEMVQVILPTMRLLNENMSDGYVDELIVDIVDNAHTIFTIVDVIKYLPVFAFQHAIKILEIFHDIFEDIPNLDIMVEMFGRNEPTLYDIPQPVEYTFDDIDSDDQMETECDFE